MEFGADGRTLYVTTGDVVHEILMDPERIAAAVCERAGRTLTESDWTRHLPDVPYLRVCPAA